MKKTNKNTTSNLYFEKLNESKEVEQKLENIHGN